LRRKGDPDILVKYVQKALRTLGYNCHVNGYYDRQLKKAIKQYKANLEFFPVDDKITASLRQSLFNIVKDQLWEGDSGFSEIFFFIF
jgi:hypothetical protein